MPASAGPTATDVLVVGAGPAGSAAADFVFFGAVLAVMAAMLTRSIRTQERLVGALQEQLTVDSLTGLATRRAFDGALARARGGGSLFGASVGIGFEKRDRPLPKIPKPLPKNL